MIKPRALKKGATVGLTCPSGAFHDKNSVANLTLALQKMGCQVLVGESCTAQYGYLSGSDELRARCLMRMFEDDSVDAVFCARGGYGAARLVPMLDYPSIRRHPKIFLGYSDITALHAAINAHAELITFHGPMFDLMNEDAAANVSRAYLLDMLQGIGGMENPPEYPLETLNPGRAVGRLVGGNLTVLAHALGTPYAPEFEKSIIFLEDIREYTYRIDEMLVNLRNAGAFESCAGIVFGDFCDCQMEYPDFSLTLREIIEDVVLPSGKPVLFGLRAGHCSPKLTLPMGALCTLDADAKTLTLNENAVLVD